MLLGHPLPEGLDGPSRQHLQELRQQYVWLASHTLPVGIVGLTLTLYTYAGTRINSTLQAALKPIGAAGSDAFTVTLRAKDAAQVQEALDLIYGDWTTPELREAVLSRLRVPRLSKYQAHLPPEFARRLALDALVDWTAMLNIFQGLPPRSSL